jgi:hypothetical protein
MTDLKKPFAPEFELKPGQEEVQVTSMVLGTFVVKFDLPMQLIDDINKAYDENVNKLPEFNQMLAGKIAEEKLINDILTPEMKGTFLHCFKTYLEITKKSHWVGYLDQAWINEMKSGEYNPNHFHTSKLSDLGLSSVLMLKRPSTYGKEPSPSEHSATNGFLEFISGDQGALNISQIRMDAKVGEFYVFPFSLYHGVYPFNGTDEVRRTMSINCNLFKPSQVPESKESK